MLYNDDPEEMLKVSKSCSDACFMLILYEYNDLERRLVCYCCLHMGFYGENGDSAGKEKTCLVC